MRSTPTIALHRPDTVQRLEAEAVRDAILAVSGKLNTKTFGPPVPIRENEVGQFVVGKGTKDLARGSVTEEALPGRRDLSPQRLRAGPPFDARGRAGNIRRRRCWNPTANAANASTATPQALLLLNSEFIQEQSRFHGRARKEGGGNDRKAQVGLAWRLVYGTEPNEVDVRGHGICRSQLAEIKKHPPPKVDPKGKMPPMVDPEIRALSMFGQALLSSNRFLYVD